MLGVSGDQAYSPQLAKLLARKEKSADEIIYDRGRAALALGLLQAKEYGKDLVKMISSTNEYDRAGAAMGLGWMGDRENASAVAQLLKDKDELVREAAKQSLEMMGASDLIKDKK
jgi:HEAT repeat protein